MPGRVLFVDDEETIRKVLPAMMARRGFEITVAATVGEAVGLIASTPFDVLLTDLNIGQPGDGFTVASAMRRIQPEAIILILTGFPDFESALNAIRAQVDDYVMKPPDFDKLARTIEACRSRARAGARIAGTKRVADIIDENTERIFSHWNALVNDPAKPPQTEVPLEDGRRFVKDVLSELVYALRNGREVSSESSLRVAAEYGRVRRAQGCSVIVLLEHSRMLQRSIYDALQEDLLAADLSWLIPDIMRISDGVHEQMIRTVEAYMRY